MQTTSKALSIAVIAGFVSTPMPTNADEHATLVDASFELRTPSRDGGWTLFDESAISSAHAHSGDRAMYNAGYSQTTTYPPYFVGMASGSFQQFPADAGSQWRLTGYGMTPVRLDGTPAFGILQITFFDADGNDIGTLETSESSTAKAKTSNEVNNQTPAGEWTFLDTGLATAPDGTASVQAFTLYVDYSGTNKSQGVFFDDLSLCEVGGDSTGCAAE